MSCGNPHETDCTEVLAWASIFLNHDLADGADIGYSAIEQHLVECPPCLEKYGDEVEQLQWVIRVMLNRCCGHEHAPDELRARVVHRIHLSMHSSDPS